MTVYKKRQIVLKNNIQRIELFGYPGSGKTTALQNLAEQYSDFTSQKANVVFNVRNSFSLLKYMLFHPKFFQLFKLKKHVPTEYSEIYRNTIFRFLLRMMVAEKSIKNNRKEMVDEGVLQITWSLLLLPSIYSPNFDAAKELRRIIKDWWPKENILVYYIKINSKEYINRVNKRRRVHFFSKEFKAGNQKYHDIGQELFNLILQRGKRIYRIQNIDILNNKEL